jgi:molecular chaperone IbpA|tara:strand:+ start:436 stop:882 length:447 start_codon:yes stop_codon:yes gene_type:complete
MVTSNTLSLFNENFNKLTPYAVGFDRMFDNLSRYVDNNTQSTGFPPYNIRKEGDYNYVIEMALAGFGKKDIEIEVRDGTLAVRSTKESETDHDNDQLYRGISYRKFDRKFTLSEDIIINDAKLENGMLLINLERIVPEEKKPRLIEVK